MIDLPNHWDNVYRHKDLSKVSWHQPHSTISYDWILSITKLSDKIIDVGSGVSVLADNLLTQGYTDISLLELSETALKITKNRLKKYQNSLTFLHENVLNLNTNSRFNLWHDRAVFHFLTEPAEQQTYIQQLQKFIKKNGFFLLATFATNGPISCSNLNIVQYDARKISSLLGKSFELIKTTAETHTRPDSKQQNFNYFLFVKK